MEKGAWNFSELTLWLAPEVKRGDREVEDRISRRPEVPFMAGSFEGSPRETSRTVKTHCYMQATGRPC